MDDVSMEIHHIREHLTPLGGDTNLSTTVCKVQVPDATFKGTSIIITMRLKKYQLLKYLPRVNNTGRHIHRVWDQEPESNSISR